MIASVPEAPKQNVEQSRRRATYPRSVRLLRHSDFERVYKQGRRHFSASMAVFYWQRRGEQIGQKDVSPSGLRVGFTVGRALGGAVQRNRIKRRLREAVRLSLPLNGINADVVINPKKVLLAADFEGVRNEVRQAFAVIEQKLKGKAERKAAVGETETANRKPQA